MKRSLTITIAMMAIICLAMTETKAQIEHIKMTSDSSVVLDKIYIGTLGMTSFSTDSVYVSNYGNVRMGATFHWDMTEWLTLNSYYMHQYETDQSWGLNQFSLKIAPCKRWSFQIGHMGTLSTQQRPHPVSAGGQFETWTEAQIPGGGLGAKTTYSPVKNLSLGIGVVARGHQPEYHANISFKKLTLSGYYGRDQKVGAALSYTGSKAWTTLVWKQDKVIADRFGCKLSKKHNICLYSDFGYDFEQQKITRGEAGIYKIFIGKHWSVLPVLGYNYQERAIRGYLFVHIWFWWYTLWQGSRLSSGLVLNETISKKIRRKNYEYITRKKEILEEGNGSYQ